MMHNSKYIIVNLVVVATVDTHIPENVLFTQNTHNIFETTSQCCPNCCTHAILGFIIGVFFLSLPSQCCFSRVCVCVFVVYVWRYG